MSVIPPRVAVFIDYQNVHKTALELFWPSGARRDHGHVDPLALARRVLTKRRHSALPGRLARVYVYRGRPDSRREPAAAAANDRQADEWTRSPLVVARRRALYYPRGWPRQRAREKGVDVALAVDFVRLAIEGSFDVGIVFSADSDLLPALETVRELKCARAEVAAWDAGTRIRFPGTSQPWCTWLDDRDYQRVRDHQNYAERRRP